MTGKAGASPAKAPSPQHPSNTSRTGTVTRVKPESRSSDKLVAMKEGQCEARKSIRRPESDAAMVTRVRHSHD